MGKGILSGFGDKLYRAFDFWQHTSFWFKANTEEEEGEGMAEGGKEESKTFQDTMETLKKKGMAQQIKTLK